MLERGISSKLASEDGAIIFEADGLEEEAFAWSTSLLIILLFGPLPWIPLSSILLSVAVFFAKGEAKTLPAPAKSGSGDDEGLSSDAGQDLLSSAAGVTGADF